MKRNLKKVLHSWIACVLVLCIMVGILPTVALAKQPNNTIKYLSLGDSMTNGYGISSGYTNENQGFQNTAEDIYPTQFKNYLENEGYNVDFYQYSMSAMRVEDLHFLLNLPENANETPLAGRFRQVQEQWNAVFDLGDSWTFTQFVGYGKRFPKIFGDPNSLASGDLVNWIISGLLNAADTYEAAVKDADLISMAYGNASLGAFCMDYIWNAFGDLDDLPILKNELELDRVLAQVDPEMAQSIESFKAKIESILTSVLGKFIDETTADIINYFIHVLTYAVISHVVNYAGALEDIAILNEKDNLEIVVIGIMNVFNGVKLAINDNIVISMEEVFSLLVNPINDYMENLPAKLQRSNPDLYGDIKFIYAEASEVDCVINHFDEITTNPIMRERVFTSIVGSVEEPGTVWSLMQGPFASLSGLTFVTLDEVRAYENDPASLTGSSEEEIKMKQLACAVYLGFEDGIVKSTKITNVTLDSLLSLGNMGSSFGPIVNAIATPVMNWNSGEGELSTITESLSNSIAGDIGLSSMFNVNARFKIGEGIGQHPSAEGHLELAEAVIEAYDNSDDSTFVSILKAVFNVFLKIWQKFLGLFN